MLDSADRLLRRCGRRLCYQKGEACGGNKRKGIEELKERSKGCLLSSTKKRVGGGKEEKPEKERYKKTGWGVIEMKVDRSRTLSDSSRPMGPNYLGLEKRYQGETIRRGRTIGKPKKARRYGFLGLCLSIY